MQGSGKDADGVEGSRVLPDRLRAVAEALALTQAARDGLSVEAGALDRLPAELLGQLLNDASAALVAADTFDGRYEVREKASAAEQISIPVSGRMLDAGTAALAAVGLAHESSAETATAISRAYRAMSVARVHDFADGIARGEFTREFLLLRLTWSEISVLSGLLARALADWRGADPDSQGWESYFLSQHPCHDDIIARLLDARPAPKMGIHAVWRGLSALDPSTGKVSLSLLDHGGTVHRFQIPVANLSGLVGAASDLLRNQEVRAARLPSTGGAR